MPAFSAHIPAEKCGEKNIKIFFFILKRFLIGIFKKYVRYQSNIRLPNVTMVCPSIHCTIFRPYPLRKRNQCPINNSDRCAYRTCIAA